MLEIISPAFIITGGTMVLRYVSDFNPNEKGLYIELDIYGMIVRGIYPNKGNVFVSSEDVANLISSAARLNRYRLFKRIGDIYKIADCKIRLDDNSEIYMEYLISSQMLDILADIYSSRTLRVLIDKITHKDYNMEKNYLLLEYNHEFINK